MSEPNTTRQLLPKNAYILRILKTEKRKSKEKGYNMLAVKLEVCDNSNPALNGTDLSCMVMLEDFALDYSTGWNNFLKAQGQKPVEHVHADEVDPVQFIGNKVAAVCLTETGPDKDADGQPMINPVTGKPIIRTDNRVTQFLSALVDDE